MASVVVFTLVDGSSVELVEERQLVDIAGWLDDEHVAVVTYEGKTGVPTLSMWMLSALAAALAAMAAMKLRA